MSNNNEKKGCLWYVGYVLGWIISQIIKGIIYLFKILWKGTIKAPMKLKELLYVYIGLAVVTALAWLIGGGAVGGVMIFITLATIVTMGIWYDIKYEKPMREKREIFDSIFTTINFKAGDGSIPYLLGEHEISEFLFAYSFNTLLPLATWQSIKATLEMYMNVKISEIRQDTRNNRVINVLVQSSPLPQYAEWSDKYISDDDIFNIGVGYSGVIGMNLEKYPHGFIAGETGCGKSNILKRMIHQALEKDYGVTLIDFKRGVSFTEFSDDVEVFYEYEDVIKVLQDLVTETKNRLDYFRRVKVDNIKSYNTFGNGYMKRKIVFIDELAELLKTRDKQTSNIIYDAIETLTRLSRATGIHLIMGIQRPDSTIVSGQIKNNVSYRVCGRFVDKEPSRIMLSDDMASSLPNINGRFIIKDDCLQEVQCFYFTGRYSYQEDPPYLTDGRNEDYEDEDEEYPEPELDDDAIPLEPEDKSEIEDDTAGGFNFDFSDYNK